MKHTLIALFCSLLWINSANAQTCSGSLPFTAAAPLHVGIDAAFSSHSHTFAPGVSYGKDQYFFRVGADVVSFSEVEGSSKGIFGMAGAEYRVQAANPIFVCPTFSLIRNWGPSVENGFDLSSWLVGFGGSAGFVAAKTGTTNIVPTFTLMFNHLNVKSTLNFGNGNNESESAGESFGTAQFGVGFHFTDRYSLVPSVVVPFGLEGMETSFSVLFTAKIGR